MSVIETLKHNALRLMEKGQACSALPLSEILCELEPNAKDSQLLRARALFEAREFDNVLRVVEGIIGLDKNDGDAHMLGMKASFELGALKQCMNFAERLVGLPENNVNALCYMAKCAELSGETEKAIQHYRSALKCDPFCSEAVDALISRRLLDASDLVALIDSLDLPSEASVLRNSYKARIHYGAMQPISFDGVPQSLLLLQNARRKYVNNNMREALTLTTELLLHDPYSRDAVCLHLSILVDMRATPKLFEKAHFLIKSKARSELAVYAIGCYHFSLSHYERAGRYFSRATELDCYFAEAWIAYGHCYAKLEEGEQALHVYRRAMNYFPGLSLCSTLVGMQYSRVHRWPIAMCFFEEAQKRSPGDPLVLNEIGVLHARTDNLNEALHFFRLAYENLPNPENPSEHLDCIVFNLATILRKKGDYAEAMNYYSQYVRGRPNASHGHCALGFTLHLAGNLKAAIAHYHTALSMKQDSFCREMLDRALATDFGQNVGGTSWGAEGGYGSPSPGDVSFSSVSKRLHSDSVAEDSSAPSPRPSVGRSLLF